MIEWLEPLPVWGVVLAFLAAAAAVWGLGWRLTGVLDAWAERTGVGRALVGMLLLGGITSLPELANVIGASTAGQPALAVNNLLGSAAINIVLLAAVDAVVGRQAVTAVQAQPGTLMMCVLSMLVLILAAAAITVGDVALWGVGLWSMSISIASVVFFLMASSYDRRAPWRVRSASDRSNPGDVAGNERGVRALSVEIAVLAAAIFAAGYALSATGEVLAERSGLGAGVVGFLFIGMATSLPELSTITAALRLKRYEMAFGQVLGTNFVNLALFVVADIAFTGGAVINELGRFEVILALLGATLTGVFLVGLLERRDPRIMRMGYDSLAVIVLFVATSAFLIITR
jgi:cation:H+ antiporter